MAAVKGAHVWKLAESAGPRVSLDDGLYNLLFTGFESRVDRSRRIVLPVRLTLTSDQNIVQVVHLLLILAVKVGVGAIGAIAAA